MNTLNLDQNKFKSISSNLLEMVNNHEGEIGHAQMLQMLAQSIYNKPFEEVQKTYFPEALKPVYFFFCHERYYVFVGKKIVYQSDKMEEKKAIKAITNVKGMKNWTIKSDFETGRICWTCVPFIIDGKGLQEYAEENDYTDEEIDSLIPKPNDVYKMATMLGYTKKNLLSEMSNATGALIGNLQADYLVTDNIVQTVQEEGEDAIVWSPEAQRGYDFYEFYFTLKEMAEAVYCEEMNCWDLTQTDNGETKVYSITLVY